MESKGGLIDVSIIDELIAFDEEKGGCAERPGVCAEIVEPIGATTWDAPLEEPFGRVTDRLLSLVNGGVFSGRCFILVMTISANKSGWILDIRISSDSAPLSPSAIKAPIMAIICSTGVKSVFNEGILGDTPLTE